MTEPDEQSNWRIWAGAGLVEHAPMSDARRAAIARETERERKALELEEEQRRDAAIERVAEPQRQGHVPLTVAEKIAAASIEGDRDDRRAARLERESAEIMGLPEPHPGPWQAKRDQREWEAQITTPASLGQLGAVQAQVQKLKDKIHSLTTGK
jgi:hypothetical protein